MLNQQYGYKHETRVSSGEKIKDKGLKSMICSRGWGWKRRVKSRQKKQHEQTYGKPMCHLCEEYYKEKSKKHDGYTYFCNITGNDVGQSHFGLVSPRNCPKR